MQTRYIPAIIMLAAGAVISVLNIINKVEVVTSLKQLLFVLVLFYVIGLIAKSIIEKVNRSRDISLNSEQEEFEENSADDSNVTAEEENKNE